LLYDGVFYLVKSNSGILTALDAKTGEALFGPERLDPVAEIYASPVAAAGRIYILGRDGNALVLASGRKLEILAKSSLDDGFDASPVLSGKEMYLRGYRHLYKLRGESPVSGRDESETGDARPLSRSAEIRFGGLRKRSPVLGEARDRC